MINLKREGRITAIRLISSGGSRHRTSVVPQEPAKPGQVGVIADSSLPNYK